MIRRVQPPSSAPRNSLLGDESGATLMEFGLVSVAFITMLLGMMDIGHMAYTQAVLNGAAQAAARETSLETGDSAVSDAEVTALVRTVAPGATVTPERVSYFDFDDVERAEKWNDEDSDGTCNNDENYVDENENGQWDEDVGVAGNGGAGDVVIYTISINYKPLFAIPFYDSGDAQRELSTTFVRKNQPFSAQMGYGSSAGVCV